MIAAPPRSLETLLDVLVEDNDDEAPARQDDTGEAAARNGLLPLTESLREQWAGTGFDAKRLYLRDMAKAPLLSAEEEQRYGRLVLKGDAEARRIMIESNLRLVVTMAGHYQHRGLPFMDLIEEGNLGLIHAVEKFDPERGFRFSTYAAWWIRQTIERGLINHGRTVRLPIHIVQQISLHLRAYRQLSCRMPREPRARDIAKWLGESLLLVDHLLTLSEPSGSLDVPVSPDDDTTLMECLSFGSSNTLPDLLQDTAIVATIDSWLNLLNARQRDIVIRRYGLHDRDPETLEGIARSMHLTRERIRQLQAAAIKQLGCIIRDQGYTADALLD